VRGTAASAPASQITRFVENSENERFPQRHLVQVVTSESGFAIFDGQRGFDQRPPRPFAMIRFRAQKQVCGRGAGFPQAIEESFGRHQKFDRIAVTMAAATWRLARSSAESLSSK
jgi:hypothetical protein